MKTVKAFLVLAAVLVIVYQVGLAIKEPEDVVQQEQPKTSVQDEPIKEPAEQAPKESSQKENQEQQPVKETPNEATEVEKPIDQTLEEDYELEAETNALSNKKTGWSFKRNTIHEQPIGYAGNVDLSKYGAYYVVDTDEKVMYLTFDEGYENGYTPTILDVLKENDVQATFFVTLPYIKTNQELVKRMKEEGHLIGNHSKTHPSFPDLSDEQVIEELKTTEDYYKEITGYDMDPFFRPPMGEYSERVLYLTRKEGYRTIFWSIAYKDWDVNKQPGKEYVYHHFMENHHPGAMPLVHAVSSSNTEALDDVIKAMKAEGYRFGSLYEIE